MTRRWFLTLLGASLATRLLPAPAAPVASPAAVGAVQLVRGGVTVGRFATVATALKAAVPDDVVLLPPGPGEGLVFPPDTPERLTIRGSLRPWTPGDPWP